MPVKKKAKPAAGARKGEGYVCGVCGYSVVVDEACGCEEEHIFICCDQPMKKKGVRKTAARKPAAKKKPVRKA